LAYDLILLIKLSAQ